MLTDKEVLKLIQEKKITFDPFDINSLKAGRYEVHLGQFILVPKDPGKVVDPLDESTQPEYDKIDLKQQSVILKPGTFVLGQTDELVGIPADIGMLIDGSTTLARLGLTIHQSATFLAPGQDPHVITLEFYNAGIWDIKLTYGMRIGKILAFRFSEKNVIEARSYNHYNGQKEATGSIFKRMK